MDKLQITPNEWRSLEMSNERGSFNKVISYHTEKKVDGESICNVTTRNLDRAYANAQLIADAGTTYNIEPILPSDLLKAKNELLEALDIIPMPGSYNTAQDFIFAYENYIKNFKTPLIQSLKV